VNRKRAFVRSDNPCLGQMRRGGTHPLRDVPLANEGAKCINLAQWVT
jgi:hypothetical protein